ncbi:hypothetical protein Megvenef_00694 [Candidatus Megaera venefica]|uniref:Uncharacterized protein n=1 Tax=Candidatus Megaera venefica TaxID=2055910 RepID=A0ABU5NC24_9RICK|nr:hypothetical protein [Candidatus Megaera venefica]MEA0970726.1 hypothetical protein [Candidatus Megaera venefica]
MKNQQSYVQDKITGQLYLCMKRGTESLFSPGIYYKSLSEGEVPEGASVIQKHLRIWSFITPETDALVNNDSSYYTEDSVSSESYCLGEL